MSESNDELDRAIDDVAREMMRADVSAGFRSRVVAGLGESRRALVAGLPRWAWAGAVAAAAMVVAGVWLARPGFQPQPEGSFVHVTASNTSAPPALDSPVPLAHVVEPSPVQAVAPRRRAARPAPPEPGLAWEAGPAPLPHPDPIAIDTLAPPALAVPGFDVAPLDDIQPITIPAAGPGLPEPQRREPR